MERAVGWVKGGGFDGNEGDGEIVWRLLIDEIQVRFVGSRSRSPARLLTWLAGEGGGGGRERGPKRISPGFLGAGRSNLARGTPFGATQRRSLFFLFALLFFFLSPPTSIGPLHPFFSPLPCPDVARPIHKSTGATGTPPLPANGSSYSKEKASDHLRASV